MSGDLFLLTRDPSVRDSVYMALANHDRLVIAGNCTDALSLSKWLQSASAGLVLVDIEPNPLQMLDQIEPLMNRYAHIRFVALANELTSELVFRAMQAGIRHVHLKANIGFDLANVLDRIYPSSENEGRMASKVITVLSAGGGCGATTFAVNLANEIQLLSEHDTLLIDFDMYYGPIAASLDISARYSINEVMEHTTDIDAQLLLSTAMHYSPRLNVLISPAATDLNAIHPIKPETLSLTLAACRSACRYTVLDAPRLPMDATSLLASESDVTYVVLHPTVCHVRTAKILFKHFESAGLDMDRVHPVLADLPRAMRMISATDIRKALDKDQIHEIAYDPKTAVRCINYGKMVAETAPRSALRKSVLSVSKTLAEKKQEGHGNR